MTIPKHFLLHGLAHTMRVAASVTCRFSAVPPESVSARGWAALAFSPLIGAIMAKWHLMAYE
jgi:hypothetical protein